MTFKFWSQTNESARKELEPDFGLRSWKQLSQDDKYKIWIYLESFFFNRNTKWNSYPPDGESDGHGNYYEFFGDYGAIEAKKRRIYVTIFRVNHWYKAQSFGLHFLNKNSLFNACKDFYLIFINQSENVVMELLSIYTDITIDEREDKVRNRIGDESEEEYNKYIENWKWQPFEDFSKSLNEVFSQFGLNLTLTRLGFVSKQEEKIINEVYKPVLTSLSHPKWQEVNKILSDAFTEYRKNTPQGYSTCITHAVSAVQAFLQILVNGKTGSGDITKLISEATKKKFVSSDSFTQTIFKNIESILMRERQETGDSHPKKKYANEKNALLILNIAMVFFQHCITKN